MKLSRRSLYTVSSVLIGLVTLLVYLPLLASHTSYLYHEDDAHHFNRSIEMAQRGDLHPHYFNKPALHFYLRMPIIYAAVAYERLNNRINSIKDIRTRDPYGLGGFAFSPSHPRILAWVRGVSVGWTGLLAVVTFLIVCGLRQPIWSAWLAALLVLLSPEVTRNSYIVGVDTLMALGCVVTTAVALRCLHSFSISVLALCALLAGLSSAAKYNAAPICVVPLTLWWMYDKTGKGLIVAVALPVVGFLLGAPYSILAFDEFWSGVSYELWHYGVAGHEGHSSKRGFPQAIFYLRWLLSDGVGVGGVVCALIGVYYLSVKERRALLLLGSFPAAYTALMIAQKTNFTRNMLVIVPYCAIAAAYGVAGLGSRCKSRLLQSTLAIAASAACLWPVGITTYHSIRQDVHASESREQVIQWLLHERPRTGDVAIAGTLQVPIHVFSLPGVDAFDPSKLSLAKLIQSGYEFIVVPTDVTTLDAELCDIVRSIPGEPHPQRVPQNPAISILRARTEGVLQAAHRAPSTLDFSRDDGRLAPRCSLHYGESHCWVHSLITDLVLPPLTANESIGIMSPWRNQTATITDYDGNLVSSLTLKAEGQWESLLLPTHFRTSSTPLILTISQVHSPESQGLQKDSRRLGIALRKSP